MPDELFSARQGRPRRISQDDFANLIWMSIVRLRRAGYFDEALAVHRGSDGARKPPVLADAEALFVRRLKESGIYEHVRPLSNPEYERTNAPIACRIHADVLWDVLEFLHAEIVLEPQVLDPVTTYNRAGGQRMFRETINPDLSLFDPPMEMLGNGQIVERAPAELRALLDDPVPDDVPDPLRDPLRRAVEEYRRRDASDDDKRVALRHLADVLEPLRSRIDEHLLPADERALFQIANKFWIRHNDRLQQRDYDGEAWLDWMFYVYVATARALLTVIERGQLVVECLRIAAGRR